MSSNLSKHELIKFRLSIYSDTIVEKTHQLHLHKFISNNLHTATQ
jgi:hypothetical protein